MQDPAFPAMMMRVLFVLVLSPDQADDIRDAFNEDFMDTSELVDILLSDANNHVRSNISTST